MPSWRSDALRTTFWVVPVLLIGVAIIFFVVTFEIDLAAFHHRLSLPWWVRTGSADAGRQVLIAIAAAIITTIGVVFSITILALTLASQQFGPRPSAVGNSVGINPEGVRSDRGRRNSNSERALGSAISQRSQRPASEVERGVTNLLAVVVTFMFCAILGAMGIWVTSRWQRWRGFGPWAPNRRHRSG